MNMHARDTSFRILAGLFSVIMTLLMMLPMKAAFGDNPADVSGHYAGSMEVTNELGETTQHPAVAVLQQSGSALTGTIGFSADHQAPIRNGQIRGNRVSFSVLLDGAVSMKFNLDAQGGAILGTAHAKGQFGPISAKVSLSRGG